jgi:hypothetical protein
MLLDYLINIPDQRRAQGRRYKLHYFLLFAIFAILSGAKSYRDVNRFIAKRLKELNKLFALDWKRAPSKSQVRDIVAGADRKAIEKEFRRYSESLQCQIGENSFNVSIDGKALKGSFDHSSSQDMLQILSAFCAETKIILGQVDIGEKTNEIPTAQQLIRELGLPEGTVYTADAMHCQKKHLKLLKKRKAN